MTDASASRLLPEVLREHDPAARSVVLTVDVADPVARRVHPSGGPVDGGRVRLGGSAGPPHVLRLDSRVAVGGDSR